MVMTMKVVKGISLFIVYPLFMLVLGFYGGVKITRFFYPGNQNPGNIPAPVEQLSAERLLESADGNEKNGNLPKQGTTEQESALKEPVGQVSNQEESPGEKTASGIREMEEDAFREAASSSETLSVDTKYVLEETDVLTHSVVETTWRLPGKYVGMNREQFLEAMEVYEAFPPLSEMERGFVSLEVLSFSRERVVVRMNYKFVQPSASFYIAVYDNNVIVYLEDKETVYIETDIRLDALPEELQQSIMQMMWVEDQEKLYDFLENYSS